MAAEQEVFDFDKDTVPERVEKITVNYHRVTKANYVTSFYEEKLNYVWDYAEQIIIDRATNTLEYIQRFGAGCVISHKYYDRQGIADLLDVLDPDSLFRHVEGNGSDVMIDPDITQEYEIVVDYLRRPQLMIQGTYDRYGLPDDWPEFAGYIAGLIEYYGTSQMLRPSVYGKIRRKTNDYIFCSVEFEEDGKRYYYLADDNIFSVGDLVVVPVGNDGQTRIVKIVEIEYFAEEYAPYPLDKVKHIICKYNEVDDVDEDEDIVWI